MAILSITHLGHLHTVATSHRATLSLPEAVYRFPIGANIKGYAIRQMQGWVRYNVHSFRNRVERRWLTVSVEKWCIWSITDETRRRPPDVQKSDILYNLTSPPLLTQASPPIAVTRRDAVERAASQWMGTYHYCSPSFKKWRRFVSRGARRYSEVVFTGVERAEIIDSYERACVISGGCAPCFGALHVLQHTHINNKPT